MISASILEPCNALHFLLFTCNQDLAHSLSASSLDDPLHRYLTEDEPSGLEFSLNDPLIYCMIIKKIRE